MPGLETEVAPRTPNPKFLGSWFPDLLHRLCGERVSQGILILSGLVRLTIDVMKHRDQKQLGEEGVNVA